MKIRPRAAVLAVIFVDVPTEVMPIVLHDETQTRDSRLSSQTTSVHADLDYQEIVPSSLRGGSSSFEMEAGCRAGRP